MAFNSAGFDNVEQNNLKGMKMALNVGLVFVFFLVDVSNIAEDSREYKFICWINLQKPHEETLEEEKKSLREKHGFQWQLA